MVYKIGQRGKGYPRSVALLRNPIIKGFTVLLSFSVAPVPPRKVSFGSELTETDGITEGSHFEFIRLLMFFPFITQALEWPTNFFE